MDLCKSGLCKYGSRVNLGLCKFGSGVNEENVNFGQRQFCCDSIQDWKINFQ